jgi:hypothetical protein
MINSNNFEPAFKVLDSVKKRPGKSEISMSSYERNVGPLGHAIDIIDVVMDVHWVNAAINLAA